MTSRAETRTLCLIVCGAGPAAHAGRMVALAVADGWTVQVIVTDAALPMVDLPALEQLPGVSLRTGYSTAAARPRRDSSVDAVVIAPATYNTINKLALGINDTYALNVAAEAVGRGTRTVLLPFVNTALANRRPFRNAVRDLRAEGVEILLGPGGWTPHPPGTGSDHLDDFPWQAALSAASAAGKAERRSAS